MSRAEIAWYRHHIIRWGMEGAKDRHDAIVLRPDLLLYLVNLHAGVTQGRGPQVLNYLRTYINIWSQKEQTDAKISRELPFPHATTFLFAQRRRNRRVADLHRGPVLFNRATRLEFTLATFYHVPSRVFAVARLACPNRTVSVIVSGCLVKRPCRPDARARSSVILLVLGWTRGSLFFLYVPGICLQSLEKQKQ